MKKFQIILLAVAAIFSFSTVKAQSASGNKILTAYYTLKDAFIAGDAATVKTSAQALQQNLTTADASAISADKTAWDKTSTDLQSDIKQIVNSKDITGQRGYFNHLSENMYSAVKTFKLNNAPVYRDYCPMKKAYWLSNSSEIANPYYGDMMLTCGQVKETINITGK